MALTPEEELVYKALLAQAEKAYHQLLIGGVASFTDQNGEKVEYRAANRPALLTYINQLREALGMPPFLGGVSRPMGIVL